MACAFDFYCTSLREIIIISTQTYQTSQQIIRYYRCLCFDLDCLGAPSNRVYYIMGSEDRFRRDSQSRERHKKKHKDKHHKKEKKKDRDRSRSRSHNHRKKQHHRDREPRQQRREYREKDQRRQAPPKELSQKVQIIKELPCFEPSGILLTFYNARDGVSLKFHEPPESRPPIDIWQIYIFKGEEVFNPITLGNSCYLFGKDERVSDILCENPSISRQHAVIQFRMMPKMNIDGSYTEFIKPYIMDLQSTNGTFLNDEKIEPSRYYELLHKDVLKFGFSDREYVLVKQEVDPNTIQQADQD